MSGRLAALCQGVRTSRGMQHKSDIALAYRGLGVPSDLCRVGDDCAAIPDGDGYTLLAIEGLLDDFVRREPWFAGYCGVMVNVSDIAAMGGRATAVVDALWTGGSERAGIIWSGMHDASRAYGVPIVGGHTNARSDGDRLAVAILGRATHLLTSFDARPGDVLLAAIDLRGEYFGPYAYWNCSTTAPHERLRADLDVLGTVARAGLAHAAKDISMGGILGTLLMLLECSGIGAEIDLERLPIPPGVALEKWLTTFPSYGFLLAGRPERAAELRRCFVERGIACEEIGVCNDGLKLEVTLSDARETFWDLRHEAFTGAAAHVA